VRESSLGRSWASAWDYDEVMKQFVCFIRFGSAGLETKRAPLLTRPEGILFSPYKTVIALTADHGEEFTTAITGRMCVGTVQTGYGELTNVPLPDVLPGPASIARARNLPNRSRLDLMPTLPQLSHLSPARRRDSGPSLLPLMGRCQRIRSGDAAKIDRRGTLRG